MKLRNVLVLVSVIGSFNCYSSWATEETDENADTARSALDAGAALSSDLSLTDAANRGGSPGGNNHPAPQPQRPVAPQPRPGEPIRQNHEPIAIHNGVYPGPHWDHPIFQRPVYQFNWQSLRLVTCTAQDSEGDQYPVTENEYSGPEYQQMLSDIEDAALDMCFQESGEDTACELIECTPGY